MSTTCAAGGEADPSSNLRDGNSVEDLYCWGVEGHVVVDDMVELNSPADVSVGYDHGCVIAARITPRDDDYGDSYYDDYYYDEAIDEAYYDGQMICWGNNEYG